jgi:glycosyltransferase involved in cell wall biosynthesis
LIDPADPEGMARQAMAVLDDPAAYRPLSDAASAMVRRRYSQDACLPRLAEQFQSLAFTGGRRR